MLTAVTAAVPHMRGHHWLHHLGPGCTVQCSFVRHMCKVAPSLPPPEPRAFQILPKLVGGVNPSLEAELQQVAREGAESEPLSPLCSPAEPEKEETVPA